MDGPQPLLENTAGEKHAVTGQGAGRRANAWRFQALIFPLARAAISLFVHVLVALCLAGFVAGIIPDYARFFRAFEIKVPAVTELVLGWGSTADKYWYLFVLAVLVFDTPLALSLQFLPDRWRWLRACWFSGYLVAAIVYFMFLSIALLTPIAAFAENHTVNKASQ